MKTIENYSFILGKYDFIQAQDLLKALYKSTINFYKIENLSSQVKFDVDDEFALNAIDKLKEEFLELEQTLKVAQLIDKRIKIKTLIEVSYE